MMHQAIHRPDVASTTLWPLAVDHAVFLYNHMPNPMSGLSPHDLLARTRWPQSELANVQVWGCPVYVLDKTMQDGKKLPRWKPRSTRQVYVGMSKKHASSVPLCLNPSSGAITSQFHIVFDSEFATVATNVDDLPDFGSDEWTKLFGDSVYQYVLDDPTDPLHPSTADSTSDDAPPPLLERVRQQTEANSPAQPLQVTPPPAQPKPDLQREIPQPQRETPPPPAPSPQPTPVENSLPTPPVPPATSQRENTLPTPTVRFQPSIPSNPPQPTPAPKPTPPPPCRSNRNRRKSTFTQPSRRSSRASAAPKRLGYDGLGQGGYFCQQMAHAATTHLSDSEPECNLF